MAWTPCAWRSARLGRSATGGSQRASAGAVRELFSDGYGAFPESFDLGDVTMASEVVLLADLSVRMLDRTAACLDSGTSATSAPNNGHRASRPQPNSPDR
jgi:hypothetical protein